MRFLILSLSVLILAVLAGGVILEDTGFVVLGFRGVVARTSLVFFIVLLLLAVAALYAAVHLARRLWRAPRDLRQWSRQRREARSLASLSEGLLALAAGDWRQAEKSLVRGAARSHRPLLHYLGAARAAQALQASDRSERYLHLAAAQGAEAEFAVLLARAEAAVQAGDAAAARAVLPRLREIDAAHPQVQRLELACARAAREWAGVLALLPVLGKRKVLGERERTEAEAEAVTALIAGSTSARGGDALRQVWGQLPKERRAQPALVALYARELSANGQGEEAERMIRAALNRQWDRELARAYGEVTAHDGLRQIKHAEGWLAARGAADVDLLLTLGGLCVRAGLWGKARSYLEGVVDKSPSPAAYRLLAETLEQLGDRDGALRCHRRGLLIATGGDHALAPPGDPLTP